LEETRTPRYGLRGRSFYLDLIPSILDVLDLDDNVEPVGRLAECERVLLPIVVEYLQLHTADIEPPTTTVGTIPLLDNWKA